MSAERIAGAFACRDPLALSDDCVPWLVEDFACSNCGIAVVIVRAIGTGIVDEEDVRCSRCELAALIQ